MHVLGFIYIRAKAIFSLILFKSVRSVCKNFLYSTIPCQLKRQLSVLTIIGGYCYHFIRKGKFREVIYLLVISVVFSSRSPTPEIKHAKDKANRKAKAAAIGKDPSPTKAARYLCVLELVNGRNNLSFQKNFCVISHLSKFSEL